jgi:hypothetical protein
MFTYLPVIYCPGEEEDIHLKSYQEVTRFFLNHLNQFHTHIIIFLWDNFNEKFPKGNLYQNIVFSRVN